MRQGWTLRRRMLVGVLALVAALATIAATCGIAYALLNVAFRCEHHIATAPNPAPVAGQVREAELYTLDCGGLGSDFDARVGLIVPGQFGDRRETVFESGLDPRTVTVTWASATALVVSYPLVEQQRVWKAVPTWQGITITYRPQ